MTKKIMLSTFTQLHMLLPKDSHIDAVIVSTKPSWVLFVAYKLLYLQTAKQVLLSFLAVLGVCRWSRNIWTGVNPSRTCGCEPAAEHQVGILTEQTLFI